MQLKREISLSNLLFLSIGSVVGSGWLFGSFYAAQIAGPAAILSWVLGGVCIAIMSLTFAELTTMLPLYGGSIVYPLLSHGKMSSAIFGWITWLWTLVIAPIETQSVIQYASNYIPNITQKINSAEVLTGKGFVFAAIVMLAMIFINMIGVKIMAETNKFIVVWKLIIPVIAAILLLTVQIHPSNLTSAGGFAPYGFSGVFSAIATGGVCFSFMGFQTVIFLAGEAKNPQKSIPTALFGSLLACLALYLMLQIGFVLSVDPASLLTGGWGKITFVGDAGPFAGIFLTLGMAFMAKVLYFDAILSPMGTGIGYVASASRVLYSMSLQNDAPKALAKVNRFSMPWLAITVNFVIGMLFFLPFSGWQSMVAFISAAMVVSLACGPVCLPIFRQRFSQLKRPFSLPWPTFLSYFSFYVCNLMLLWTGWKTIWKLEVAVLLGVVVILLSHFLNGKASGEKLHIKSSLWLILYLALAGIVSYLSSFDGIGLFDMGASFIVVAVYSLIVFVVALKTAIDPKVTQENYANIMLKNNQASEEPIVRQVASNVASNAT